jgi:hypothetical protein
VLACLLVGGAIGGLINQSSRSQSALASEARAFATAIAGHAGLPAPQYESDSGTLFRHGLPHAEWRDIGWIFVHPESDADPVTVATELQPNAACPSHLVVGRTPPGGQTHYVVVCATPAPAPGGLADSASVVGRPAGGYYVIYFQRIDSRMLDRLRTAIDAAVGQFSF